MSATAQTVQSKNRTVTKDGMDACTDLMQIFQAVSANALSMPFVMQNMTPTRNHEARIVQLFCERAQKGLATMIETAERQNQLDAYFHRHSYAASAKQLTDLIAQSMPGIVQNGQELGMGEEELSDFASRFSHWFEYMTDALEQDQSPDDILGFSVEDSIQMAVMLDIKYRANPAHVILKTPAHIM